MMIYLPTMQGVRSMRFDFAPHFSLTRLLISTRDSKATDPRDKVYDLLGMATHQGSLVPDYRKTTAEVYMEATRALIAENHGLEVLNTVHCLEHDENIPSWVTDWSRCPSTRCQLGQLDSNGRPRFSASAGMTPLIINSSDLRTLKLHGLLIDQIDAVYDPLLGLQFMNEESKPNGGFLTPNQFHEVAKALGLKKIYALTGEDHCAAYETTIAADLLPYSGRTDDSFNFFGFPIMTSIMKSAQNSFLGFNPKVQQEMRTFNQDVTVGRCFFITQKGYIGLGPEIARKWDSVVVLLGGQTPYVLRPKGASAYELIGETYVHGIMDGGWLTALMESGNAFEVFDLV